MCVRVRVINVLYVYMLAAKVSSDQLVIVLLCTYQY